LDFRACGGTVAREYGLVFVAGQNTDQIRRFTATSSTIFQRIAGDAQTSDMIQSRTENQGLLRVCLYTNMDATMIVRMQTHADARKQLATMSFRVVMVRLPRP